MKRTLFTLSIIALLLITGALPLLQAQGEAGSVIEITGEVEAINATTITVIGLEVTLTDTAIDLTGIEIGTVVTVSGRITNTGITATTIVIVNLPEATPDAEMTPDPEATPDPEITPDPEMTPDPETTPEPGSGNIIIVIEGPVTAININIITIYGFDIVLDASDPILTEIEIGQIIRVEGNLTADSDTITVIAVNITIVNIVIVGPDGEVIAGGGFSKDDCKKGGWRSLTRADGSGFRNQGDCIQYANTGK